MAAKNRQPFYNREAYNTIVYQHLDTAKKVSVKHRKNRQPLYNRGAYNTIVYQHLDTAKKVLVKHRKRGVEIKLCSFANPDL